MKTLGKWKVAVAGAMLVAAIASTAAVVAAQTPVPGASTTGTSFLSRVAAKLGIDSATLETAVKSSATDQVNEQVQAGTLTQAQADQILQRIQNAPADALGFGPGFGHGPGDHGPGGFMDQDGLAQFLGITTDQLDTELDATDATLAGVAQAHGKTTDELKAFLTSEAKTRLDQDVADGRITQSEADAAPGPDDTESGPDDQQPAAGRSRRVPRPRAGRRHPRRLSAGCQPDGHELIAEVTPRRLSQGERPRQAAALPRLASTRGTRSVWTVTDTKRPSDSRPGVTSSFSVSDPAPFVLTRYRFIPNRGGVASSVSGRFSARNPRLRALAFQRATGRGAGPLGFYPLRFSYLLSPHYTSAIPPPRAA